MQCLWSPLLGDWGVLGEPFVTVFKFCVQATEVLVDIVIIVSYKASRYSPR